MGLLWTSFSLFIFDLGVNTHFRLVFTPLADEQLVFVVVKVTALAFALAIDPVSFKVVAIALGEHSVTVALALMPLAFVDLFIGVNHAAFALSRPVNPVAVVAISIGVEEGAAAVTAVFVPIAGILATKLFVLVHFPVSALAMLLVNSPHAFILVSLFVVLDAEALFAVVAPVANVPLRAFPLLTLDGAIFTLGFFLDPVDTSVSAVLLSLVVSSEIQR